MSAQACAGLGPLPPFPRGRGQGPGLALLPFAFFRRPPPNFRGFSPIFAKVSQKSHCSTKGKKMTTYETMESVRVRLNGIEDDLVSLAHARLVPGSAMTEAFAALTAFRDALYKLEELRRD